MEEGTKSENHLTSAAAFVEGGIQDACDDTCSICLDEFSDSDPSTVTGCKHEFHLQCILEWCQRSSQCPMCWQDISLKDPSSQELLDGIERERTIRNTPSRNTTIFHHPTLGEFELQHLPGSTTDAELEERIIQHLAAAAAMGRARHIARREGQRSRASAQGRPQYLVFSTHPNSPSTPPASFPRREGESSPVATVGRPSLSSAGEESLYPITSSPSAQVSNVTLPTSVSNIFPANPQGSSSTNRRSPTQSSPNSHDTAGPSELQSFSESFKSRINTMSMRYKESIAKSTRGWKERLFSRNTSIADLPEGRRDANSGVATVSHMMDRLTTGENTRTNSTSVSNTSDGGPQSNQVNQLNAEHVVNHSISANNTQASSAAPTASD